MSALRIQIQDWIDEAGPNRKELQRRQAIHILFSALAAMPGGERSYWLKGGTLMNLVFGSRRRTADVDFSTAVDRATVDDFPDRLEAALRTAARDLGYLDYRLRIHKPQMKPAQPDHPWPTLYIGIAYTDPDDPAARHYETGQPLNVLHVDISFNEVLIDHQEAILVGDDEDEETLIITYSLVETIAEKLRALLMQVARRRIRRQDVYDIAYCLRVRSLSDQDRIRIYTILLEKSRARNFVPAASAFDDPEIKTRASQGYDQLEHDLQDIRLDFEADFALVRDLYNNLPWD